MTKVTFGRGARGDTPAVTPPKSIERARAAIGVVVLALVVRALGLLGSTESLRRYLADQNDNAKKPIKNYDVDGALHSLRVGSLIQTAVMAIALGLLVYALRRARSASGSRWALLIIIVLTSLPFYVVPISGWPVIPKVASVIAGLAAIVALVLVFVPTSSAYFRRCRDAVTPPELRGQPRPGLAGLFGPRARRGGAATPHGAAQPARPARATRSPANSGKSRAKVRSDAEAIARGAELARSRAKASKSRRSDV